MGSPLLSWILSLCTGLPHCVDALIIPLSLWHIKLASLLSHFPFDPHPELLPTLQANLPPCKDSDTMNQCPFNSLMNSDTPHQTVPYVNALLSLLGLGDPLQGQLSTMWKPLPPHLFSSILLWPTSPLRCPLYLQQAKPAAFLHDTTLYTSKLQHPAWSTSFCHHSHYPSQVPKFCASSLLLSKPWTLCSSHSVFDCTF